MIPHPVSSRPPQLRIGLLLARRFTLSAFGNFVDVLRLAADEGDQSRPIRCDWHVLAADATPVPSSSGISVTPDARLSDPAEYDYIAVVGGLLGAPQPLAPAQLAYLHRAARAGIPLIGLCTGAFILHDAGLMDGYRCCVSWFHHNDFAARDGGLHPISDRIFVVDRDRLTCAGGVGAAHLAAWLVDRHVGSSAAHKSLNIMLVEPATTDNDPGQEPQPALPLTLRCNDPLVRRALLRMQDSLDAPVTVATLAESIGVTRRRLERHFRAALGMSPAQAGMLLRLAQARHLLRHSRRSVTAIAQATGFCDMPHLARVFRRHEGMTPGDYRAGVDAPVNMSDGKDRIAEAP
ncbi:MAG: GlxA family transcriptional regulator [Celeribacter sp.]|jgi:transcriptional regulator GlxA family with amidase domain